MSQQANSGNKVVQTQTAASCFQHTFNIDRLTVLVDAILAKHGTTKTKKEGN